MNKHSKGEHYQFGGTHYIEAGDLQHWNMLAAAGYGWEYYTGNATRYLSRNKESPLLDAQKAGHFLDKLIELIDKGYMPNTYITAQSPRPEYSEDFDAYMLRYLQANKIGERSNRASALYFIMTATNRDALTCARAVVQKVIDDLEKPPVKISGGSDPDRVFVVGDNRG